MPSKDDVLLSASIHDWIVRIILDDCMYTDLSLEDQKKLKNMFLQRKEIILLRTLKNQIPIQKLAELLKLLMGLASILWMDLSHPTK